MNQDFQGAPQQLQNAFGYCIQAIVTGTPNGSVSLEASIDPVIETGANYRPPTNWNPVDNSTFVLTTAGNTMWNVSDAQYNWVRVIYVDASGGLSTAVMTASINTKGF